MVETCEGNQVADIKNGWSNACRVAEALAAKQGVAIDLSDATPHVLRHTAITWAMQLGAEPEDVSGFFGVSLQTIESVYGHHHPDHQASAMQAMGAKVSVARHGNRAKPGAKPEK